jgi:hypothetical protein
VPVIGITWWGLIDQVDWGSGLRRRNYEIDPTGLYSLRWVGERLERVPTEALDRWREYTGGALDETVGLLAGDQPVDVPLW